MNIQGGMGQMPMGGNMGQGIPNPIGMGNPGMQVPMGACMPGPGGNVLQGMVSSPMGASGGMMHQNPGTPGQMQPGMSQQQAQEKLDNISKVKSLMLPLRESLMLTLKTAAQTLHQNNLIDAGTIKGVDNVIPRFDKNLEEFYSICDQIELNLKTSQECMTQGGSSGRYLPLAVAPTRTEPIGGQDNTLTYPQYLATTRAQISYVKEIHDSLLATAQTMAPNE